MKPPPHPTDELAEIRAEMARLRLRESQLRQLILALPDDARQGRWFHAEIKEITRRFLDPARLPPEVLRDPGHYSDIRRDVLHCRAISLSSLTLPGPLFGANQPIQ